MGILSHLYRWDAVPRLPGQPESEQLARIRSTADGYNNVLPAIEHVRHRGSALRCGHEHGARVFACCLVVCAEHGAALSGGGREKTALAGDDEGLGHQRPD